jgi:hypothetical protein
VTTASVCCIDADGLPEEHDKIVDVVVVHSGEGTTMMQ